MNRIFSWILKHRLRMTAVIILVAVLVCLSPLLWAQVLPLYGVNESRVGLAVAISQILSAIFVIAGTVIAVWQYYISSKGQIVKMQTEKVQKAIDLTQYYKDEILELFGPVKTVYMDCGAVDILEKEKGRFRLFNMQECEELFRGKTLEQLKKMQEAKDYLDAVVNANVAYDLHMNGCQPKTEQTDKAKQVTMLVDPSKLLFAFRAKHVIPIMNNLEYFATYFTHNIADESVVYELLQPSYCEICRTLYFDIAKCSEPGKPPLYRNLTRLYIQWSDRERSRQDTMNHVPDNPGTIPENFS